MESNPISTYRLPAEWEPQRAVQLTWPHAQTDWKPYLAEITQTFLLLAKAIIRHEDLIIATPDPDNTRQQLATTLTAEEQQRVHLYATPTNDTWARDHGPLTLVPPTPQLPQRLLNFKFNAWGEKFAWEKDNAITPHLYDQGAYDAPEALAPVLESHTEFVLEGGSIESDGHGTLLTTSSCLLAPHRNEPMDRQSIERYLLQALHAHRVLWVDHGQLIGDDTDGHIDTTVRFAPDDTLLYIGCDDSGDPQQGDFQLMEQQLQGFRTTDGRPYRLLRLPFPDPITYDGERLPATYANFLVINGAVIVPTYAQPEKDRLAMDLIHQAFPDREIVGIDARIIIRQHGSIHCLTMQLPQESFPSPSKGRNVDYNSASHGGPPGRDFFM